MDEKKVGFQQILQDMASGDGERVAGDANEQTRPIASIDNAEGAETERLLSEGSISPPIPRTRRNRHRSRVHRYLALLATGTFILVSIALTVLYFTLPRLIRNRVLEEAGSSSGSLVKTESIKLGNVTDSSFDIQMALEIGLKEASSWGALVAFRQGKVYFEDCEIADFDIPRPVYLKAAEKRHNCDAKAHVVITDPVHFGRMLNGLLMNETVSVTVKTSLWVKPDHLPALPSTPVVLNVPVDGIPTLIERLASGASVVPGRDFDIVGASEDALVVRGRLPMPSLELGLNVYAPDTHSRLAGILTKSGQKSFFAVLPRFNDDIRRVLRSEYEYLEVKGNADLTGPLLENVIKQIDFKVPVKLTDYSLVSEIVLLDLFGKSASVVTNPFSQPLHVIALENAEIRYRQRLIGTLESTIVDGHIPAKVANHYVRTKGKGKIKYEGGVADAVQLLTALRRDRCIVVDVIGEVSVRIGRYEATRLPIRCRNLRVSYGRKRREA